MRTNIDIDDKLMKQAMKATGATTKKEVVHTALKTLIRLSSQEQVLKKLWGIGWEGDLDAMRESRFLDWDMPSSPAKALKKRTAA
jgi:Arc/MetJ family transcription regulator